MKNNNIKDPYKILGVEHSASDEEIKKSYREKVKVSHPDTTTDEKKKKELEEKFKEISNAYEILSDPAKKSAFDNPQPEFDPSMFFHGGGVDLNEIFSRMAGGRMGNFHFGIQTQLNKVINLSLKDILSPNKDIDLNLPEISKTITFKLPSNFSISGETYQMKINNGKNNIVILNLTININLSSLTEEQKTKIKEILK